MTKQNIIPHLWYNKEAKEAATFYVSVFGMESNVTNVTTIHNTPSGDCDIVSFRIRDLDFMAISAGPYFKFTQAISFMVNFDPSQEKDAKKKIDVVWKKLMNGGKALMPLQEYPWSKRFGWVQDRYGLSWQLILTNPEGDERPLIIPNLLFVSKKYGKAEEAVRFYLSVFEKAPFPAAKGMSKLGNIMHYGPGLEPNKEGTVMFSDFKLLGSWFAAMDGGGPHEFDFNEAVSLIVNCDAQEEIDYYWKKLSAVPEAEQCGWLRDKFGVSWQIVPASMNAMMSKGRREQVNRVTQAFLKMKKFDIRKLEKAYSLK